MSSAIGGHKTAAVAALPPQWVDDVDGVHGLLSDITRSMAILMSMHSTRVGTVFGKDLDDMEIKIENLTKDITGECCSLKSCVKSTGHEACAVFEGCPDLLPCTPLFVILSYLFEDILRRLRITGLR